MLKFKKLFLAGALSVALAASAFAAGLYTNGLPVIQPPTVQSASTTPVGAAYPQLTYRTATVSVDTNLAQGLNPATVAAQPFFFAALASEIIANSATSTAGAATLNTNGGLITTEALTTASGAIYPFTLTDSVISTTVCPMFAMYSKSNNAVGASLQPFAITCSAGSAVLLFKNNGTAALNGTMLIAFHI